MRPGPAAQALALALQQQPLARSLRLLDLMNNNIGIRGARALALAASAVLHAAERAAAAPAAAGERQSAAAEAATEAAAAGVGEAAAGAEAAAGVGAGMVAAAGDGGGGGAADGGGASHEWEAQLKILLLHNSTAEARCGPIADSEPGAEYEPGTRPRGRKANAAGRRR